MNLNVPASFDASYGGIWRAAWPIMLANAAVPMLGLVDTAVLGHLGQVEDLGALSLGSMIFNFVYWTFGFLRMGTTGFVARAWGAGDELEVHLALGRALLLGALIGLSLVALRGPIAELALALLSGGQAVEERTRTYVQARIWGAPAALCSFGLMGTLIGLGRSRAVLAVQLFANGLNILLDLGLAGVLGWGARGVGLGTAISDWASALFAALLVLRILGVQRSALGLVSRLLQVKALLITLGAHVNIMLRTLFLLAGFAWFTERGARFGDATLAANHVLLQLVSFAAFFLDGYAFVTESMVGAAVGRGDTALFDRIVSRTGRLAGTTALGLAAAFALFGGYFVSLLTDLEPVVERASQHLAYVCFYVPVAAGAFQLDGIFIGATRAADMRNGSLASLLVLLAVGYPLTAWAGNHGLWLAFVAYALARTLTLALLLPRVRRQIAGESREPARSGMA